MSIVIIAQIMREEGKVIKESKNIKNNFKFKNNLSKSLELFVEFKNSKKLVLVEIYQSMTVKY